MFGRSCTSSNSLLSDSVLTSLANPINASASYPSSVLANVAVSSIASLMSSSVSDESSSVNSSTAQLVATTASPLQRMASITNSLVTGPPLGSTHGLSQKPMKAVLPPITQQQFDMYSNINTEDIVKRVSKMTHAYYSALSVGHPIGVHPSLVKLSVGF